MRFWINLATRPWLVALCMPCLEPGLILPTQFLPTAGSILLRATGPLHVPCTLHIPYKHLSYAPEPITLQSPSCTCTLVQVTSLNLDYLTFPLFSCIFLFLSCTQHERLTKLFCQDLVQHNTVYSSFSRSFLSFLSKFLILYVSSIKH